MDHVTQQMANQAAREPARYVTKHAANAAQWSFSNDPIRSAELFTSLNAVLIIGAAYTIYLLLRPKEAVVIPRANPVVFRTFTPHTLLPYNGEAGKPIYFAVRGRVFDVSSGRNFYGPGGPYANFAGRDASRGLACGSFDEDMLTEDLDGPLDLLEGLGSEEMDALRGWEGRFEEKYDIVGKLLSVDDFNKTKSV